jgi:predicted kinase
MSEIHRFAFIMRGVPGSGKSTITNLLANSFKLMGLDVAVHRIDDLHTSEDGVFFWEDDLEEQRYNKNFDNFCESCNMHVSFIFCDAINLQKSDYNKYIDYAKSLGYFVSTVCPELPTADEAANRNKHDVTVEQIHEMLNRWEP